MGCFTKDTKIKTPLGYATIKSLKKGDLVKSYNLKIDTEVDSEVTETFLHKDHGGYLVLNGNIKTTSNHPFYSNGEWVVAGELSIGDKILHVDGLEHTVESIEEHDDQIDVYNIEVDGTHNYYAEDYLVHNKGLESLGSGESVMVSGSLEGIPHISMSVGDKVLSADITGLPDTDVASEYLLWEYTGSLSEDGTTTLNDFTSSQITLATSSIVTTGSQEYISWLQVDCANGRSDNITITNNHTMLVYSSSAATEEPGVWYFEYVSEIGTDMQFLSSSLEPIDINSITAVTASESASFYRFDIEPHDVYFVDGVLVHN